MTPSRVAISSLPNGTILVSHSFAPASGATAYVYAHNTDSPVTVYEAETGSGSLSQPLTADVNGQLPGYVLGEEDIDVIATYKGHTAGAAEAVPLRASDLVGVDAHTKAPALGAGNLPLLSGLGGGGLTKAEVEAEVALEATARASADTALSTGITNAIATAEAASDAVGTAATDVAVEKTRALAAEGTIATNLATEVTNRTTAVAGAIATAEGASDAAGTAAADVATEKTRALAAEALLIPVAQRGAANGVPTLDGEEHLTISQVPPSVVRGSATGGAPAWIKKTAYKVNELVASSEVTYICLEAHESGETFSGIGTHWAPVAGVAVEVSAPTPTGVAATDTANLQAALTAAAGGVCKITKPGTYAVNATLVRPYNASVFLGPNCILQATAVIAGPVLSDVKTERSLRQSIVGGGVIDSNNKAQNALWCRYFQRGMTLGVVCKNSTQSDCILGDSTATALSDEAFFTSQFACDRTGFSVPAGGYSLWLQNCSDAGGVPVTLTGQERGVRADLSDCKFFHLHPYGAAYPMNVMFEDNGLLNEWHGCVADTPTPLEHTEATGEAASTTITDTAILAQHKGLPVTGANIPANSYVGAVKAGENFTLATNAGVGVKPTGAVAGIKLMGTGWMMREPETRIIGGTAYNNPTYGVDNGAYATVNTSNAVNSLVVGLSIRGGDVTHRFAKPFVGNILNTSWVGITQVNCVESMSATTQLTSNHGGTLKLTNSATANFLEVVDQSSNVLVKISSTGQISGAVLTPNINTTGKTTAEITTAVEALHFAVATGMQIVDTTNKLILFYSGAKWLKTAALTEIA